ncbi:MAG: DUF1232 domain-containing protein [Deltaproteobacteria bacterium]|nr:DUF1232 domain-containing protein [Deltaproteobacteria bacterium]
MEPELTDEERKKALDLASKLADDFNAERSERFASKHRDKKWYDDFTLLLNMIRDREFKINPGTWAILAGALAYVVMPVDVIPDFIPGLGWIDDTFVLAMVISTIESELRDYKAWRNHSQEER